MTIKKKRLGICLALLMVATLAFSLMGYKTLKASSEGTWQEVQMEEIYSVGDEIKIPASKLTVDGKDYAATCTVVFPDGSARQTDKIVVKESGEYKLVYKAVVNGKAFEKTVEFLVNNTLYSVDSSASSAWYGTNSYLPEDVNGINLSLAAGDKFSFNKVIDLTGKTKEDKICKFYLTPKKTGEPDVAQVKLTLTDIYNPENFITMTYKCKILSEVNYGTIYRTVGAGNQPQVGLHYAGSAAGDNTDDVTYIQYGNYWFSAGRNPIYGAGVGISSDGNARGKEFIDNYEYLAMDYESKQVFAHPHWFTFEPYNLIADLDDYRMMGDALWEGFTTGECLLTIEGENYISSSLNMFITEVAGHDLTDYDFKDDRAPLLTLDFGGYTQDTLPKAIVNKPYRVFEASAHDNLDGAIEPTVTVYYNYYSDMRTLVNVENGAFMPKRAGTYTVIYTAKDSVGNVSTQSYDVVASVPSETLSITAATAGNAVAAAPVRLGKYTVENNNGNYSVSITATLKADTNVSYTVDTRSLTFTPLYTGEFEIKYTATDYVETVDYTYDLTVQAPQAPQFVEQPNLPRYLIKGAQYTFDGLNAYSYTAQSRTDIASKVYVVEDNGGDEQLLTNHTYTVAANGVVKLVYKATDGEGDVGTATYEIPVVDVAYGQGEVKISEYFQGNGFKAVDGANGIVYTNENAFGNVKLSYIRQALLDGFKFEYQFVDDYADYKKITFTLTDLENKDNVLRISMSKTANEFLCYVHDNARAYSIPYSENMKTATVSYNRRSNTVTFNNSLSIFAGDCGFDGFDGYFVDFDVVFEESNGKVGIELNKLYMQPLSTVLADNISPQMLEYNKGSTRCQLNETVTITAPYFFDVLDPNIITKITVLDPNGGHVTAKDGTVLADADATKNYEIDLTAYGMWSVSYTVEDNSGNNIFPAYVIRVEDNLPPTVEFSGAQTTYAVGDELSLPTVTVLDNYSQTDKLTQQVLVRDAKGVVSVVKDDYTFKLQGKHTVYYYVIDEAGNAAIKSYDVTVVAGGEEE